MSTDDVATSARPRAATSAGSLLTAELARLRHRRLVAVLLLLGLAGLLAALAAVFFTHDRDVAAARATAQTEYERQVRDQTAFAQQCRTDPAVPESEKETACPPSKVDPSLTPEAFYRDPRLRADQGLPAIAIGVAVAGALLMGLVAATAVGADWSSRAIVTLLTWQPRRLRFLATRFAAIGILAVLVGVVGQALGLGLGALIVATRGTFEASAIAGFGDGAPPAFGAGGHLWRDLLLLQGRGVLLMVLAAVVAAAIATITRSTGGFLGVALGWFVVVELAGQGLLASVSPGLAQWTLTQNVAALLTPGGSTIFTGERAVNGVVGPQTMHLSNLDGAWHLGALALLVTVLAGVTLRRRDL